MPYTNLPRERPIVPSMPYRTKSNQDLGEKKRKGEERDLPISITSDTLNKPIHILKILIHRQQGIHFNHERCRILFTYNAKEAGAQ